MSRWGKPTKNKRRVDPRYFLEEQQNWDQSDSETGEDLALPSWEDTQAELEGEHQWSVHTGPDDSPRMSIRPPKETITGTAPAYTRPDIGRYSIQLPKETITGTAPAEHGGLEDIDLGIPDYTPPPLTPEQQSQLENNPEYLARQRETHMSNLWGDIMTGDPEDSKTIASANEYYGEMYPGQEFELRADDRGLLKPYSPSGSPLERPSWEPDQYRIPEASGRQALSAFNKNVDPWIVKFLTRGQDTADPSLMDATSEGLGNTIEAASNLIGENIPGLSPEETRAIAMHFYEAEEVAPGIVFRRELGPHGGLRFPGSNASWRSNPKILKAANKLGHLGPILDTMEIGGHLYANRYNEAAKAIAGAGSGAIGAVRGGQAGARLGMALPHPLAKAIGVPLFAGAGFILGGTGADQAVRGAWDTVTQPLHSAQDFYDRDQGFSGKSAAGATAGRMIADLPGSIATAWDHYFEGKIRKNMLITESERQRYQQLAGIARDSSKTLNEGLMAALVGMAISIAIAEYRGSRYAPGMDTQWKLIKRAYDKLKNMAKSREEQGDSSLQALLDQASLLGLPFSEEELARIQAELADDETLASMLETLGETSPRDYGEVLTVITNYIQSKL